MQCELGKATSLHLERLFIWVEQNAKGQGSLEKDIAKDVDRLKKILSTSYCNIEKEAAKEELEYYFEELEFLEDNKELYEISRIFLQIPWKYSGGMLVGKEYAQTKDFLKWAGYKPKKWASIIQSMAAVWINNIPKKSKS